MLIRAPLDVVATRRRLRPGATVTGPAVYARLMMSPP